MHEILQNKGNWESQTFFLQELSSFEGKFYLHFRMNQRQFANILAIN